MSAKIPDLSTMTVESLVTRWVKTISVFTQHQMACVGCPLSQFYTVTDAAREYNLPLADFLAELEQAILEGEEDEGR
jgi:hybrid cluster-associated redox disulfide protein